MRSQDKKIELLLLFSLTFFSILGEANESNGFPKLTYERSIPPNLAVTRLQMYNIKIGGKAAFYFRPTFSEDSLKAKVYKVLYRMPKSKQTPEILLNDLKELLVNLWDATKTDLKGINKEELASVRKGLDTLIRAIETNPEAPYKESTNTVISKLSKVLYGEPTVIFDKQNIKVPTQLAKAKPGSIIKITLKDALIRFGNLAKEYKFSFTVGSVVALGGMYLLITDDDEKTLTSLPYKELKPANPDNKSGVRIRQPRLFSIQESVSPQQISER